MTPNHTLIQNIYTAFSKGDVPTVLGSFDPAIHWLEAENFLLVAGNPYTGPQAIAEGVFMRLGADVEGFAVHPENFIDGGDTVVVEGRYRGRYIATDTPVDAQFAHVWHVSGGKVVRFQQYTDTKQWSDAAGV